MLPSVMLIQEVIKDCASFGVEVTHCIYALFTELNMIQRSIWYKWNLF